ncbi:MAG: hypothetical protein ACOY90_15445 [Candidatus Zhuqueibacterota bacterium]
MKTYFLLLISLLSPFFFISRVISLESIHLSADSFKQHEHCWLRDHWKYHSGDNSEWSQSAFDDGDWEFADPILQVHRLPTSGWNGLGWFRIHLVVDSTLWHQSLVMNCNKADASPQVSAELAGSNS